ncbi:hypothetical protein J2T07_002727 [Luteibacter jiangsuensis]|uniref:Uncharacterized protein n=1 Tax=Luteibacter jiangsuensis TaxID=637577 RepID=A0ABT9T322_9GAMM|nr:hypothetical protein [Luteibacter jiangsuensis]
MAPLEVVGREASGGTDGSAPTWGDGTRRATRNGGTNRSTSRSTTRTGSNRTADSARLICRVKPGRSRSLELARNGVERVAVVRKPLLVVAELLLVPVVVSLVDVALSLVLLDLRKLAVLAVELRL